MIERKRKKVVFGVFILIVLFGLYMKPWEARQRRIPQPSLAQSTGETILPAHQTAQASAVGEDAAQIKFATRWPDDPFRQVAVGKTRQSIVQASEASGGSWVLQGVMTINGERVCVIDGWTYVVGTTIDNWKIIHVGQSEVGLARGGETCNLTLSGTEN